MKATKMRNNQIYRASLRTRSNQLGSPLSKELQKKYGKRSVRVAKGDTVKVVRGEYKNVDGKVARVSTQANGVAIEGVKKEKGQGDKFDVLIHTTNIIVTDLNTDDYWRVAKLEGKSPKSTPKPSKTEKTKETTSEEPKETTKIIESEEEMVEDAAEKATKDESEKEEELKEEIIHDVKSADETSKDEAIKKTMEEGDK